MRTTTTPFLVIGAALAADVAGDVYPAGVAPEGGESFGDWVARTVVLLAVALLTDEWRRWRARRVAPPAAGE